MDIFFWKQTKALIKGKGLTQAQFCKRYGLNFATMHGWIAKRRLPDINSGVLIANALGTTVEVLLGKEPSVDPPEIEKVKHSPATQHVVTRLLDLKESEIQQVDLGVKAIVASMGHSNYADHSANAS